MDPFILKPSIPIDNLSLRHFSIGEANYIKAILLSEEFLQASTFREQVGIMCRELRNDELRISYRKIGMLFNCNPGIIKYQEDRFNSVIQNVGRPAELSQIEIDAIKNEISSKIQQKEPITFEYIANFVYDKFNFDISLDTLRHIVYRFPDFKTVTGVPMDKSRVMVDIHSIAEYFMGIKSIINNIPSAFIFNLDESGFCDYQDAHEIKVIVNSNYNSDKIEIPVNRDSKRASLLHCIAADGSYTPPCIILSRKTIETEVFDAGLTPEKVLLLHQTNGFMTNSCFDLWFYQKFIPYLQKKREDLCYFGSCIIIMDQFGSHCCKTIQEIPEELNIIIQYLPPHTSDQLQPLDLGIFGIQKRKISSIQPNKNYSKNSQKFIKIFSALHSASTPTNIISAFRRGGIKTKWMNGGLISNVNTKHCDMIRKKEEMELILKSVNVEYESSQTRIRLINV